MFIDKRNDTFNPYLIKLHIFGDFTPIQYFLWIVNLVGGAAVEIYIFSEVHWNETEEDPIEHSSLTCIHVVLPEGEKIKAEQFVLWLCHFNLSGL